MAHIIINDIKKLPIFSGFYNSTFSGFKMAKMIIASNAGLCSINSHYAYVTFSI